MNLRHVSAGPRALLIRIEVPVPYVYDDGIRGAHRWDGKSRPVGHLTAGAGHVVSARDLASGRFAHDLSAAEIDALMAADIVPREQIVCSHVVPELGDNRFGALVIFVYNWGHVPPEVAAAINAGADDATIKPLWLACNTGNGIPHLLDLRRAREWALWCTPDPAADGPTPEQIAAACYAVADDAIDDVLAGHVHGPETG